MPSKDPNLYRRHVANIAKAVSFLDEYKTARGCVDCGYRRSPSALHFDHVDPATKRADLGWYPDRSRLHTRTRLERYLDHVERYCELRCANCHAERTEKERHWTVRRDPVVT